MDDGQNRRKLYNALVGEGYDNWTSFEDFDGKMNDGNYRGRLYKALKDEGYDNWNTQSDFEKKYSTRDTYTAQAPRQRQTAVPTQGVRPQQQAKQQPVQKVNLSSVPSDFQQAARKQGAKTDAEVYGMWQNPSNQKAYKNYKAQSASKQKQAQQAQKAVQQAQKAARSSNAVEKSVVMGGVTIHYYTLDPKDEEKNRHYNPSDVYAYNKSIGVAKGPDRTSESAVAKLSAYEQVKYYVDVMGGQGSNAVKEAYKSIPMVISNTPEAQLPYIKKYFQQHGYQEPAINWANPSAKRGEKSDGLFTNVATNMEAYKHGLKKAQEQHNRNLWNANAKKRAIASQKKKEAYALHVPQFRMADMWAYQSKSDDITLDENGLPVHYDDTVDYNYRDKNGTFHVVTSSGHDYTDIAGYDANGKPVFISAGEQASSEHSEAAGRRMSAWNEREQARIKLENYKKTHGGKLPKPKMHYSIVNPDGSKVATLEDKKAYRAEYEAYYNEMSNMYQGRLDELNEKLASENEDYANIMASKVGGNVLGYLYGKVANYFRDSATKDAYDKLDDEYSAFKQQSEEDAPWMYASNGMAWLQEFGAPAAATQELLGTGLGVLNDAFNGGKNSTLGKWSKSLHAASSDFHAASKQEKDNLNTLAAKGTAMLGTGALAVALSATGSPELGAMLMHADLARMIGTGAGEQSYEARQHGASNTNAAAQAALNGLVWGMTSKFIGTPFGRYLSKSIGAEMGSDMLQNIIKTEGKENAGKIFNIIGSEMDQAARKYGVQEAATLGSVLKGIGVDAAKGAMDMSTASAVCAALPYLMSSSDDRSLWGDGDKGKKLSEMLTNSSNSFLSGAKDGALMSLFFGALGTGSKIAYKKYNESKTFAKGEGRVDSQTEKFGVSGDGQVFRIVGDRKRYIDVPVEEGKPLQQGEEPKTKKEVVDEYKVQTADGRYTYVDKKALGSIQTMSKTDFKKYYKKAQEAQGKSQFVIGQSLETAIDKAKAKIALNEAGRALNEEWKNFSAEEQAAMQNDDTINQGLADGIFTEEHAQLATAFRDASNRYDGVVNKARSEFNKQLGEARQELDKYTFRARNVDKMTDGNGKVVTGTVSVKTEPKEGEAQYNNNGTTNMEDHEVYVLSGDGKGKVEVIDQETGKTFMVDESEVKNRQEREVDAILKDKEQQLSKQMAAAVDGKVSAAIENGEELPILVDGEEVRVKVTETREREGIDKSLIPEGEEVPKDYVVTFEDGQTQRLMSEEELQDAYSKALGLNTKRMKLAGDMVNWRKVIADNSIKYTPKSEAEKNAASTAEELRPADDNATYDQEGFRTSEEEGHEPKNLDGVDAIDGDYIDIGDHFSFDSGERELDCTVTGIRQGEKGREFRIELADKETGEVIDETVMDINGINKTREENAKYHGLSVDEEGALVVDDEQAGYNPEETAEEEHPTYEQSTAEAMPTEEAPVPEETPVDPVTGEKRYDKQPTEKTMKRLDQYEKAIRDRLVASQLVKSRQGVAELEAQMKELEEAKPDGTDVTDLDAYDEQMQAYNTEHSRLEAQIDDAASRFKYWFGIAAEYKLNDMADDARTQQERIQQELADGKPIDSGVHDGNKSFEEIADDLGVTTHEVRRLDKLAKDLGVRVEFSDLLETDTAYSNGEAGVKSRTVTLSKNSIHEGKGLSYLLGHELLHILKGNGKSNGMAEEFLKFAKRAMGDDIWTAEVEHLMAPYSQVYTGRTPEELEQEVEEEVAANFAGELLSNPKYLAKLTNERFSTLEKIENGIKDILNKAKNMSPEELAKVEAAQNAFEGAKAALTVSEAERSQPELWRNERTLAEETKHSIDTLLESVGLHYEKAEDGSTVLKDKDGNVMHDIDVDYIRRQPLGVGIMNSVKAGYITPEDGMKQYDFLAQLFSNVEKTNDLDMVFAVSGALAYGKPLQAGERQTEGEMSEDHGKSSRFNAMTSNSDPQYGTTFDVTTICLKTKAIIDAMSATMVELDRGLTAKEVVDVVYRETAKAGETVPCPVCYVFSRWVGNGGILNNIAKWQEKYTDMPVEEIRKHMNELDEDIQAVLDEFLRNGKDKRRSDAKTAIINDQMNEIAKTIGIEKGTVTRWVQAGKLREVLDLAINRLQYYDMYQEFGSQRDKDSGRKAKRKGAAEYKDLTEQDRRNLAEWLEKVEMFNEYTWLKDVRLGTAKDENGVEYSTYEPVDHSILFDFNRGREFAEKYPSAWKYRTTRGPSAGKAITPYAPEHYGQTMRATDVKNLGNASANHYLEVGKDGNWDERTLKELERRRVSAKAQNLIGGQRMQSTSDFRPEYATDYLIEMLELQTIGSKVQLYTKVPEAVGFLASCGAEVNMSLMPKGNGWQVKDEKGNWVFADSLPEEMQERIKARLKGGLNPDEVYNELVENEELRASFSDVTGMNEKDAFRLMDLYDNAQPIMVGTNDVHMWLMLADARVPFIIPFHPSGGREDNYRSMMATLEESVVSRQGYDRWQTDTHYNAKKKSDVFKTRCKILSGKALKGGDFTEEIETTDEFGNTVIEKVTQNFKLDDKDKQIIRDTWIDGHDGGCLYILHDLYKRFYGTDVDGNTLTPEEAQRLHMTWNEETQQYEGDCTGVELGAQQREQIFPYEYWDKDGTIDTAYTNGEVFKAYCEAMKIKPRFCGWNKGSRGFTQDKKRDFSKSHGYWKLLIDRRMYGRDGKYREPKSINVANMEGDFMENAMNRNAGEKPVWDRAHESISDYRKRLHAWEMQNPYYQNAAGVAFEKPSRSNNPAMTADIVKASVSKLKHSVDTDSIKKADETPEDYLKRRLEENSSDLDAMMKGMPTVSAQVKHSLVTDPKEIDRLNNDPEGYIDAYCSMVKIDGKYYSPMAFKRKDENGNVVKSQGYSEGDWDKADECSADDPNVRVRENGSWQFGLRKPDGSTMWVAYDPYEHSSLSPLNDQFTSAWNRPELVLCRVRIPKSDLKAGEDGQTYKAEGALLPVGEHVWNQGPVSKQLEKYGKDRKVILSQHRQIVGEVSVDEEARLIADYIKGYPEVSIPINRVRPQLLQELMKLGVNISETAGTVTAEGKEMLDNVLADYRKTQGVKHSLGEEKETSDSILRRKELQNELIQEANPKDKNLGEHTWIESTDDIKTFEEAVKADGLNGEDAAPDFTAKDITKAIDNGHVTVYSSHDISNGDFVTPSRMEAKQYAGDGKVYEKEVPLEDVAWIDTLQGQYAPVKYMVGELKSLDQRKGWKYINGREFVDREFGTIEEYHDVRKIVHNLNSTNDAKHKDFEDYVTAPSYNHLYFVKNCGGDAYDVKYFVYLNDVLKEEREKYFDETTRIFQRGQKTPRDFRNALQTAAHDLGINEDDVFVFEPQQSGYDTRLPLDNGHEPESESNNGVRDESVRVSPERRTGYDTYKGGTIYSSSILNEGQVGLLAEDLSRETKKYITSDTLIQNEESKKYGVSGKDVFNALSDELGSEQAAKEALENIGAPYKFSLGESKSVPSFNQIVEKYVDEFRQLYDSMPDVVPVLGRLPIGMKANRAYNEMERRYGAEFKNAFERVVPKDGKPYLVPNKDNDGNFEQKAINFIGSEIREIVNKLSDSDLSKAYTEAVNSGNIGATDIIVRERAHRAMPNTVVIDEDGYPKVVYHGTLNGGFYSFKDLPSGTFLTNSKNAAEGYAGGSTKREEDFVQEQMITTSESKRRYDTYINMEHPFVIDANKRSWLDLPEIVNGIRIPDSYKVKANGPVTTDAWAAYLKEHQELGYDGIICKNVYDTVNSNEFITDYIVFDPKNIKVVNPVTRDDAGNIIPLEERMNLTKNDVRYSMGDSKGQKEGESTLDYLMRISKEASKNKDVQAKKGHSVEWRAMYDAVKDNKDAVDALTDTTPKTVEDVAADVLRGVKLLWSDEGAGEQRKRGAQSALGWKEGERRKFVGLFAGSDKGGVSIDEAGEMVEQACRDQHIPYDEGDAMAGRNAVENVLRGSETRADINRWNERSAMDRAQSVIDEVNRLRDEEYLDKYGMTYDEYMQASFPEAVEASKAGQLESEAKKQAKEMDKLNASLKQAQQAYQRAREKMSAEAFRHNMDVAKNEEESKKREAEIRAAEGKERFRANQERDQAVAEKEQAQAEAEQTKNEAAAAISSAEHGRLEAEQRADSASEQLKEARQARKALQTAKQKLMDYIQGKVNAEWMPYVGKRELNKLLVQMRDVETPEQLEEAQSKVMEVAGESAVRFQQARIDKIWKTPVEGRNAKGISVAKTVDNRTKDIIQNLKKSLHDSNVSGMEDQLSELRRERMQVSRELKEAQKQYDEAGDADKATAKQALDDLQAQHDALTKEMGDVQEAIWNKRAENETNVSATLDEELRKLDEKQQKAANGEEVWRDSDTDKVTEYTIRKLFADAAKPAQDALELKEEIRSKQQELEDLRKRIAEDQRARKENERLSTELEDKLDRKEISFTEYLEESGRLFQEILAMPEIESVKNEYWRKKGEFERTINESRRMIAEARMAQAERLDYVANQLNELISTGHSALKERVEQQVQHRAELLSNVFEAIKSGKHYELGDGESIDHKKGFGEFFRQPLYSFEYMVRKLCRNDRGQDGFLYKYFMESEHGVVKAQEEKLKGIDEATQQLNTKVTELFKIKDGAFNTGAWERLAEKADKLDDDTGIMRYDMKLLDENGLPYSRYEWKTSKGSAMYVYMLWKMADGKVKLENQGFDDVTMKNVEDYLKRDGEKYIELADWLQKTFLPEKREKYNAKHIEMYNTSMARIENYVPLDINKDSTRLESNMEGDKNGGAKKKMDTKAGSLINRTFNLNPININKSAFDIITHNIEDMEDWCAFVGVRRDIDTILSSKHFKNQVDTNYAGDYDRFYDAAAIACNAEQPDKVSVSDAFWSGVTRGVLGANISFKVAVAMKQLLSYPAYLGYTSDPTFLPYLLANTAKSVAWNNLKWCRENIPTFKQRVDVGDLGNNRLSEDVKVDLTGRNGANKKAVQVMNWLGDATKKASSVGMLPNRGIDALTCSMGIKAIYDYEMHRARKYAKNAGLTGEELETYMKEADENAKRQADMFYNSTQQSSQPAFLSKMQTSKAMLAKAYSAYQNSNIAYTRMMMLGAKDIQTDVHYLARVKHYKEKFMEQGMDEKGAAKEARKLALKNMGTDVLHIAVPILLKYWWAWGGTGLLGFLNHNSKDDDKDKRQPNESEADYDARMKSKQWFGGMNNILKYTVQGLPFVGVVSNGLDYLTGDTSSIESNPVLGINELDQMTKDIIDTQNDYGLISPEMCGQVVYRLSRFSGIDIQGLTNIIVGVDGLMHDYDKPYEDWMTDVMYMLNLSKSGRKEAARTLAEDSGDIETYARRIAYAEGVLKRHPELARWLPSFKSEADAKLENQIIDDWNNLKHRDHRDKQISYNDAVKQIENASTADELWALRDKLTDQKLREKAANRAKEMGKPKANPTLEERATERLNKQEGVYNETWQDSPSETYNYMATSEDIKNDATIKEETDKLTAINKRVDKAYKHKPNSGYIKDLEERHEYKAEHKDELDKLKDISKLQSKIRDLKKDLNTKSPAEQQEAMEEIREKRDQIMELIK